MPITEDCAITPLSEHTGAEVHGVDLARPVDAALRARLNQAFVRHSVLVLRDQHLSPQQLLDAVQIVRRGVPAAQHALRVAGVSADPLHLQPGFLSRRQALHSRRGLSHRSLECRRTAEGNGAACRDAAGYAVATRSSSTCIAHTTDLPETMRNRIDGMRAVHVYQSRHSERKLMALSDAARAAVPDGVLHPLVRTHPESGRKSIYLNPIRIEGIVGMEEPAAMALAGRTAGARDAAAIRVPPPVAAGRHGDVGQPLPAAQGER